MVVIIDGRRMFRILSISIRGFALIVTSFVE